MNEENNTLSQDINDAIEQFSSAIDYMDAWHDETLDGTLDKDKSDLEFKRQLLLQLIKMNHTFDLIRAGLYATVGIELVSDQEEPPA